MSLIYKLTRANMTTYGDTQWALNEAKTAPGTGPLCSSGWLYAYEDPLVAVFMDPLHGQFGPTARLFVGDGDVGLRDPDWKVGCGRIVLTEEIPLPVLTTDMRVEASVRCAMVVCKDAAWTRWADVWLSGTDRTVEAEAAARASRAAAARAADAIDLPRILRAVAA